MSKSIIKGSLSAISKQKGQTLAESFLSCDVLLVCDMSGSMADKDAPGGVSRYEVAEQDVIRLQEKYQGKVALVCFSSTVQFCPNGVPIRFGGGTDLVQALKFVKPVDGTDTKIILISDGEPFSKDECLRIAKTFKSKIDVVILLKLRPKSGLYRSTHR